MFYEKGGLMIRAAQSEDIAILAPRLRRKDADEVVAAGNKDAEEAIGQSFSRSTLCYTVVLDDAVVGMCGIVPDSILGGSANIWFLGADGMQKIKKSFVKLSRRIIAEFLSQYPRLWNEVDARYIETVTWLQSCGAKFSAVPVVRGQFQFLRFDIRRA